MVRSFMKRGGSSGIAAFLIIFLVVLGCNSRSDEEWTQTLGSRMLTRANTSGAISNRVELYFCPNGEYARVIDTTGFSGGGVGSLSMADRSVELGRWQVRGGTLYLVPEEGETSEFSLSASLDGDVVQLNGVDHLLGMHSECK